MLQKVPFVGVLTVLAILETNQVPGPPYASDQEPHDSPWGRPPSTHQGAMLNLPVNHSIIEIPSPNNFSCKVLGAELDLSKSLAGALEVRNTESRRHELIAFIESVQTKGFLPRYEGERLRGRLQFASNQLFGRSFRNCLRDLNSHVSRGLTLTSELEVSFRLIVELLKV